MQLGRIAPKFFSMNEKHMLWYGWHAKKNHPILVSEYGEGIGSNSVPSKNMLISATLQRCQASGIILAQMEEQAGCRWATQDTWQMEFITDMHPTPIAVLCVFWDWCNLLMRQSLSWSTAVTVQLQAPLSNKRALHSPVPASALSYWKMLLRYLECYFQMYPL